MKMLITCVSVLLVICSGFVAGCATQGEKHTAASVVDFLYPDSTPVIQPSIPQLKLPLRVGIAFVPGASIYGHKSSLTEQKKMELMQKIGEHFKTHPYVKDIELIPSAYLKSKGSFQNLQQIKTMYGVDVMALVSYDQVQFTDQGFLGLTYWTIVGAYIIPGEKNDTQTMLDTVVVDINSRKMLFRAPGIDHVKGNSTPINLSEQLRLDSDNSYEQASAQMIENLDLQLTMFKDKVKEHPEEYKVTSTPEYMARTGGGSFNAIWLGILAAVGALSILSRKKVSPK
jgi:rhombotail lipoprotein